MSRAEFFIQYYTRNCSNEYCGAEGNYHHWFSPEEARKAVEIAREEILLNVAEWIKDTFIFSKGAKMDFCKTFNIKLL